MFGLIGSHDFINPRDYAYTPLIVKTMKSNGAELKVLDGGLMGSKARISQLVLKTMITESGDTRATIKGYVCRVQAIADGISTANGTIDPDDCSQI